MRPVAYITHSHTHALPVLILLFDIRGAGATTLFLHHDEPSLYEGSETAVLNHRTPVPCTAGSTHTHTATHNTVLFDARTVHAGVANHSGSVQAVTVVHTV